MRRFGGSLRAWSPSPSWWPVQSGRAGGVRRWGAGFIALRPLLAPRCLVALGSCRAVVSALGFSRLSILRIGLLFRPALHLSGSAGGGLGGAAMRPPSPILPR